MVTSEDDGMIKLYMTATRNGSLTVTIKTGLQVVFEVDVPQDEVTIFPTVLLIFKCLKYTITGQKTVRRFRKSRHKTTRGCEIRTSLKLSTIYI